MHKMKELEDLVQQENRMCPQLPKSGNWGRFQITTFYQLRNVPNYPNVVIRDRSKMKNKILYYVIF